MRILTLLTLYFICIHVYAEQDEFQNEYIEHYGWVRTVAMNEEELEMMRLFGRLHEERNMAAINHLLTVPDNTLEMSCLPRKAIFIEPEEPIADITITNTSNAPIHLLELNNEMRLAGMAWRPQRVTDEDCVDEENMEEKPESYYKTWQDQAYIRNTEPRYLKILKPNESFTIELPFAPSGYGPRKVSVSAAVKQYTEMTENSSRSTSTKIGETDCVFSWYAREPLKEE